MEFTGSISRALIPLTGPYDGRFEVSYDRVRIGTPQTGVTADRGTIDAVEVDGWGRRVRVVLQSGDTVVVP